jgi:hypothetical protein
MKRQICRRAEWANFRGLRPAQHDSARGPPGVSTKAPATRNGSPTRTERTPSLLAARAVQLGVSPEDAERQDFAPDSPRGNAICRMVDASEVAFVVAVFPASEKAWAVSGELVAASGGLGGQYITEQRKPDEGQR